MLASPLHAHQVAWVCKVACAVMQRWSIKHSGFQLSILAVLMDRFARHCFDYAHSLTNMASLTHLHGKITRSDLLICMVDCGSLPAALNAGG